MFSFRKKKISFGSTNLNYEFEKKGRGKNYGRFLKMIDDLQTPLYKTNLNTEVTFPLNIIMLNKFQANNSHV